MRAEGNSMTAFYVALALGVVVAVAYVVLAGREFWRIRAETMSATPAAAGGEPDEMNEAQGRLFGWKAAAGVVASTLVLVAVSITPTAWYLLPFLAIGSSIAVIVAFVIDRRPDYPA
jgi:hypothetical protein